LIAKVLVDKRDSKAMKTPKLDAIRKIKIIIIQNNMYFLRCLLFRFIENLSGFHLQHHLLVMRIVYFPFSLLLF